MARLPVSGEDEGIWGDVLNNFLEQAHKSDGTLKNGSVGNAQLDSTAQTALAKASTSASILTTVTAKTADYPASAWQIVPVNTTGGNVAVTLPTGADTGAIVAVRRMDASANTLTIQAGGSNAIASGLSTTSSVSLTTQNHVVTLIYDGSGTWTPIGNF